MEVFIYQIIIAAIVLISGFWGTKTKNITTIVLVIFTITHIYMPWLMILQFLTISISYSVANTTNKKRINNTKETKSTSFFDWIFLTFWSLLFIIIILLVIRSIIAMIGLFTGWYELSGWFTIS